MSDLMLSDGEWLLRRGGLRVWGAPTTIVLPALPSRRRRLEPTQLIACPTCSARLHQHCRTATGRHRHPHPERLVPRRCPCGGLLEPDKKLCDTCRADARRENGRIGMQNTRARRRAARGGMGTSRRVAITCVVAADGGKEDVA